MGAIVMAFLIGCIVGCVIMCIVIKVRRVGHGSFSVLDGPDPELPELKTIKFELSKDQDLTKVNAIVLKLKKEEARK